MCKFGSATFEYSLNVLKQVATCMNDFNIGWEVVGYVLFRYLSPQGFSSLRGRLQVITEFAPQLARLVTLTASQASDEVYWWERVWKSVRSVSLSEGEEASSLGVQIPRC